MNVIASAIWSKYFESFTSSFCCTFICLNLICKLPRGLFYSSRSFSTYFLSVFELTLQVLVFVLNLGNFSIYICTDGSCLFLYLRAVSVAKVLKEAEGLLPLSACCLAFIIDLVL